jgi:hypothetical protein
LQLFKKKTFLELLGWCLDNILFINTTSFLLQIERAQKQATIHGRLAFRNLPLGALKSRAGAATYGLSQHLHSINKRYDSGPCVVYLLRFIRRLIGENKNERRGEAK